MSTRTLIRKLAPIPALCIEAELEAPCGTANNFGCSGSRVTARTLNAHFGGDHLEPFDGAGNIVYGAGHGTGMDAQKAQCQKGLPALNNLLWALHEELSSDWTILTDKYCSGERVEHTVRSLAECKEKCLDCTAITFYEPTVGCYTIAGTCTVRDSTSNGIIYYPPRDSKPPQFKCNSYFGELLEAEAGMCLAGVALLNEHAGDGCPALDSLESPCHPTGSSELSFETNGGGDVFVTNGLLSIGLNVRGTFGSDAGPDRGVSITLFLSALFYYLPVPLCLPACRPFTHAHTLPRRYCS